MQPREIRKVVLRKKPLTVNWGGGGVYWCWVAK